MIKRYVFGTPIETDAVLIKPDITDFDQSEFKFKREGNSFSYLMNADDIVYGLGENVRGINKRGHKYISYCTDDPNHNEEKASLYGAHNFIIINSKDSEGSPKNIGLFIDTPSKVTFDIGCKDIDVLNISIDSDSYELYEIVSDEDTPSSVVHEFRTLIGISYIPPKWGFGYAQSRWGYKCSKDIRDVYNGYKENNLPLDMIYLDIDYMDKYKDFTVDYNAYPDFEKLISEMKDNKIHLVPIIDGGVKIEEGYNVYEEGVANNYFCKDENGEDFVVGVWPGDCHFPDFLNDEARQWFGEKYSFLLDKGIEGFWNDMNEPAIFYSKKRLNYVFSKLDEYKNKNLDLQNFFDFKDLALSTANNIEDYRSFYHNYKGSKYLHDDIHNLFGYYMTRGAKEAFDRLVPDKRILMISRASYIGMHRYGGIWQGDNCSIWSHLLMNIKMMPSLNMCGFLYTGADMGGFGGNTTEDLVLRWTAFAVFTPLFRNHSALSSRLQEFYQFKNIDMFRSMLHFRYRIIPYLYSEFMKAALNNEMMFRPLGFVYPDDAIARKTEDQLIIGNEIMIAPIYEQNADGRVIYFPERMKELRYENDTIIEGSTYEKGFYFVNVPLGTITLYIRENYKLPIGEIKSSIEDVTSDNLTYYGCGDNISEYELYDDDGVTPVR